MSLLGALGLLGRVDGVLEVLALDAEHGLAEHLDQPSVGVPGEALVAGLLGQARHRLVAQADVQDRLHHPGHRELRPGPDADQQRVGRIAELAAHLRFELVQLPVTSSASSAGHATLLQVGAAGLGGDGEPGRHRQADLDHLGEVGTLAAEQVLQVLVTLGEVVDELRHFPAPRSARRLVVTRDSTGEGGSENTDLGPADGNQNAGACVCRYVKVNAMNAAGPSRRPDAPPGEEATPGPAAVTAL